ncbi:solute carrier family 24 (sodium/potassium/calcium exchanger), member 6 [Blastomyces parvus]|uniref:Solute carrier family 24 (Sodium/potassium/calcium exchanger), member 6 n=1 Tax=Blastomyces parvus TaxID=2060905 RepID=A0A2B7WR72_9EURO|nr:solute carrier family 24 (sodium/potassium/calcium exchanger), member 6 [Blastomyces parvus]
MAPEPSSLLPSALTIRRLKPRYSSRPFYLTLLALSVLAGASILLSATPEQPVSLGVSRLVKRNDFGLGESDGLLGPSGKDSDECHLVHKVEDQCAFVRTHCGDHEIGIFSYLQLYYCKLPHVKPIAFAILAIWLAVLFNTIGIAASDFLCVNLSTIASILGMSESLTGVTFLAFGNGSPDVFSTFAAMGSNSGSLAVGELIGAAGFITAVVAGSMALVRPFRVARRSFVRDVGFFIVAASFSLVFLADGRLHVWECVAMILFYIFYVFVVVTWHWYLAKQRRQRERDLAARAYFHIPENQELEIEEEEEDDDPVAGQTRPLLREPSSEDFGALERADIPAWKVDDVDEDADTRDLAEIQGNMRVSRPPRGHRRPTITPIRPSLVGALEFRAVLSSLQKSRQQSGPIHLRRYSDESSLPGPPTDVQSERLHPHLDSIPNRLRSASANEPPNRMANRRRHISPNADLILPSSEAMSSEEEPRGLGGHEAAAAHFVPQAGLTASPSSSGFPSRSQSPAVGERSLSPNLLAPPGNGFQSPKYLSEPAKTHSAGVSPRTKVQDDSPSSRPTTPLVSPTCAFPPYSDNFSIRSRSRSPNLQRASLSAASTFTRDGFVDAEIEPKPISWWPYQYLPSPYAITAALFPTLYDWKSKAVWEKLLGIVAAPSVLLLTITLPVVEPKESEPETPPEPELSGLGGQDTGLPHLSRQTSDMWRMSVVPDVEEFNDDDGRLTRASLLSYDSRRRQDSEAPVPATLPNQNIPSPPKEWNRWLLGLQLLVGPFFIALTGWSTLDADLQPRNLLIPSLVALLISGIFLAVLFLSTGPDADSTTTQQLPPRSRPFLAFLGFVVSIAWISTLASEVVNLLKTIGVILSISDSLLGLTIFAVGNSLGDLVADITVARLGYPVMALSACFGGPMLNILLGVGVGGLYMTLHPAKSSAASVGGAVVAQALSASSNTYEIEVSKTLLVSGATLLATLVLFLIVVPLNGWWMDRKIGWGLVVLWTVTTVANVVTEVLSTN